MSDDTKCCLICVTGTVIVLSTLIVSIFLYNKSVLDTESLNFKNGYIKVPYKAEHWIKQGEKQ